MTANQTQVGGNHYKVIDPQPWDVMLAWAEQGHIGPAEANIIKYLSRWKTKNGLDDLRKARHWLDKLIEMVEEPTAQDTDTVMGHVKALITTEALTLVCEERSRQDRKWGEQNHANLLWAVILTEEVGEFAKAALHKEFGGPDADNIMDEVVQCAAVSLAIIESNLRNMHEK